MPNKYGLDPEQYIYKFVVESRSLVNPQHWKIR